MQPKHVRLYVKTGCPWCREAEQWLHSRGVRYERLDVLANPRHFREMTRLSNQSLAPVIEADGLILADFGARELEAWWKRQGWGQAEQS